MLKLMGCQSSTPPLPQPPSGGCVLKQAVWQVITETIGPAAFRRLCVETLPRAWRPSFGLPSRLQAAVC